MDDGEWSSSEAGTPQGAVVTPRTQKRNLRRRHLAALDRAGLMGPGGDGAPTGMQWRMMMVSSPIRTSLTTSRTILWRSRTSSVSAALRSRARNAVRVSARRRNGPIVGLVGDRLQLGAQRLFRGRSAGMRSRNCSSDKRSSW